MKWLVDLFPIVLFFVAFKLAGIYVATGVAIVATLLQIGWLHVRHGKVEPMQWISLVVIVFFGGATLVFHDETFIKWKPTVLYWLFGITLLVAELVFRKNLIKANIYIKDPYVSKYVTEEKITEISFVGGVGGILGLFLGFSFRFIYHFIFLIFVIFSISFH